MVVDPRCATVTGHCTTLQHFTTIIHMHSTQPVTGLLCSWWCSHVECRWSVEVCSTSTWHGVSRSRWQQVNWQAPALQPADMPAIGIRITLSTGMTGCQPTVGMILLFWHSDMLLNHRFQHYNQQRSSVWESYTHQTAPAYNQPQYCWWISRISWITQMRPIATCYSHTLHCLCVCWADSCGPKEPRIRWGVNWSNLANTTE